MSDPGTLAEALARAIGLLNQGKLRAPESVVTAEAEQLVDAAYFRVGRGRVTRMELYARGAEALPGPVWPVLKRMAEQRASGKPLQYLTGFQTFLGHEYEVGNEVLIPRPETEVLVTRAIEELSGRGLDHALGLEVGLGSGIISIELLDRFPKLAMIATEVSPGAAKLAQRNAEKVLGVETSRLRVLTHAVPTRVCEPFIAVLGTRRADFLISNPPYLSSPSEAEEQVRKHEPAVALFAPAADPLYFYRAIARDAKKILLDQAPVFVEIPHERASEIRAVFSSEGWDATILNDLTGRERVLVAIARQAWTE
jgi:release factor glutamine methyltransferase